ncbi:MAG: hypothetical protein H6745_07080 [Deltaproteobacteria bacterium]|nr:hypothetical protein [Deltaproteobacteria bacterium]
MRVLTALAATLLSLGRACAASAAPPPEVRPAVVLVDPATVPLHEPLTVGDGFALFGLALGGGALAGGGVGSLATLGALSASGEGHFDDTLAVGVAFGSVAGSFGAAGAMHLYGTKRDLGGSFWVGTAGAAAGALITTFAVRPLLEDAEARPAAYFLSYALIPTTTAFTAYVLSCALADHGELDDVGASGGLLDVTPEHGVRLGVPAVAIAPAQGGDTVLHVGLLGGRF